MEARGAETSRRAHCLGNRLTDGVEVVSLTLRPFLTCRKIHDIRFC
jgi:hypothetical protein